MVGCKNKLHKKGLCRKHYQLKYMDKKCEVCGSGDYVFKNSETGKLLCNRHAHQVKRYGHILKRTLKDPNDFIEHGDYAEIVLFNFHKERVGSAIIDTEDLNKCREYKWRLSNMGYTVSGFNSEILLHRFILGVVEEDVTIDHIDKNKLNNRRENLRITTQALNTINKSIQSNNSSGVVGVSWNKSKNKWDVQLQKGRNRYRKRFKRFDNAVKNRLVKEVEYFKDFSPHHNPQTNTLQLTYLSKDDDVETYIEVDMNGNIIEFTKLNK